MQIMHHGYQNKLSTNTTYIVNANWGTSSKSIPAMDSRGTVQLQHMLFFPQFRPNDVIIVHNEKIVLMIQNPSTTSTSVS